jgi:hypothetical protein
MNKNTLIGWAVVLPAILLASCRPKVMCTLLDCEPKEALLVTLEGQIPSTYVVKATSPDGQTVAAVCLWDPKIVQDTAEQERRQPLDEYPFDRLPVEGMLDASAIPGWCDPGAGYVTEQVTQEEDRRVHSIGVHCQESTSPSLLAQTRCIKNGVQLVDFGPSSVSVTVYWKGGSQTAAAEPTYGSHRPNGPNCPPECKAGKVTIALPP